MTDTYSCGITMDRPTGDLYEILGISDQATPAEIRAVIHDDSPEARYAYKALNDPAYRRLYEKHRNTDILYEAGFFDDGLPRLASDYLSYDGNFPTFSLKEIRTAYTTFHDEGYLRFNPNLDRNKQVVLVTTGGMAPIHNGHIEMMDQAYHALEAQGYYVLGGLITPGHDSYVGKKYQGTAGIPAVHRCAMVDLACSETRWLQCDPWAARYMPAEINFTDVVRRLEEVLHTNVGSDIQVIYVYGSDNKGFGLALPDNSYMVERSGISSKAIREGNHTELDVKVREYYTEYLEGKDTGNLPYLIRNEELMPIPLKWYELFGSVEVSQRHLQFLSAIRLGIAQLFKNAGEKHKVCILNVREQIAEAEKVVGDRKTISLDPFYPADYYFHSTRYFELSSPQFNAGWRGPRIGKPTTYNQVNEIPDGQYVLVEDDSVTGKTIQYAKKNLHFDHRNIRVTDTVILSDFGDYKGTEYYDVVDLRDFLIGSNYGGLSVDLGDLETARAPYVQPFVSLRSRAKIPAEMEMELSRLIWQANLRFFKGTNVRIKDCDEGFIKLTADQHFSPETPMEEYCNFYMQLLLECA